MCHYFQITLVVGPGYVRLSREEVDVSIYQEFKIGELGGFGMGTNAYRNFWDIAGNVERFVKWVKED